MVTTEPPRSDHHRESRCFLHGMAPGSAHAVTGGVPTVRPPFWPILLFSLSHGPAMVFGPKIHFLNCDSNVDFFTCTVCSYKSRAISFSKTLVHLHVGHAVTTDY